MLDFKLFRFVEKKNIARLNIKLMPNASSNKIGDTFLNEKNELVLKAYVNAVPESGKANEALIALLAKTLSLAKKDVAIMLGHKDRQKVIEITTDKANLFEHLQNVSKEEK